VSASAQLAVFTGTSKRPLWTCLRSL